MRTVFMLYASGPKSSCISVSVSNAPPHISVGHTFDLGFLRQGEVAEVFKVHWHGSGGRHARRLSCHIPYSAWERLTVKDFAIPDPESPGNYLIKEWNWGETLPKPKGV